MPIARSLRPAVIALAVLAATTLTACGGGGSDGARENAPVDRKAALYLGTKLCVTNQNLATAAVLLKPDFNERPEENSAWNSNDYRSEEQPFPPGTERCVEDADVDNGSGYIRVAVGGAPGRSGWAFWIGAFNGTGYPGVRVGDADIFRAPCRRDVSGYKLSDICHWTEYEFADGEEGYVDPIVDWSEYKNTPAAEQFWVKVKRLPDDDSYKRFSVTVLNDRIL